jgi:hypothetical protein
MSVDPLNLFIQQHGRLPKLGDQPAPYTYRGWLLRYVALAHAVIPTMKDSIEAFTRLHPDRK